MPTIRGTILAFLAETVLAVSMLATAASAQVPQLAACREFRTFQECTLGCGSVIDACPCLWDNVDDPNGFPFDVDEPCRPGEICCHNAPCSNWDDESDCEVGSVTSTTGGDPSCTWDVDLRACECRAPLQAVDPFVAGDLAPYDCFCPFGRPDATATECAALEAASICGDVNNSGKVTAGDALQVLKVAVGQDVTLGCRSCGDATISTGEECEADDLGGESCVSLGFAGGKLACATGCTFDKSGCYNPRFDATGPTIFDRETGLEWEKKDSPDNVQDLDNPHDVDNAYDWCLGSFPDCSVPSNPLDGSLATLFLGKLNSACYAGHCDWRLPTIEELSALSSPLPAEFQPAKSTYWSGTTVAEAPNHAWNIDTNTGNTGGNTKQDELFARAVRGGS